MAYKVFITYSGKTCRTAYSAAEHFAITQTESFISPWDVDPDEPLERDSVQAIKECDFFLILWERGAERARRVERELAIAQEFARELIPIRTRAEVVLPDFMEGLECYEFIEDDNWPLPAILKQTQRYEMTCGRSGGVAVFLALQMIGLLLYMLGRCEQEEEEPFIPPKEPPAPAPGRRLRTPEERLEGWPEPELPRLGLEAGTFQSFIDKVARRFPRWAL